MLRIAEDQRLLTRWRRRFNAAFGGARRDEEKSRAKERIYSFRDSHGQWTPESAPGVWNTFTRGSTKRKAFVCSLCQIGPNWTFGFTSTPKRFHRAALLRTRARGGVANGSIVLIYSKTNFFRRENRICECRMRSLVACPAQVRSVPRRYRSQIIEEMISFAVGTREPRH